MQNNKSNPDTPLKEALGYFRESQSKLQAFLEKNLYTTPNKLIKSANPDNARNFVQIHSNKNAFKKALKKLEFGFKLLVISTPYFKQYQQGFKELLKDVEDKFDKIQLVKKENKEKKENKKIDPETIQTAKQELIQEIGIFTDLLKTRLNMSEKELYVYGSKKTKSMALDLKSIGHTHEEFFERASTLKLKLSLLETESKDKNDIKEITEALDNVSKKHMDFHKARGGSKNLGIEK